VRNVIPVNGVERQWAKNRYIFWFGAAGPIYLMAWGRGMEDALEACVDWLEDNAPGIFCDEMMKEEYDRAIAEGKTEEEATEAAEIDVTVFGHSGYHGILSDEWGICMENPTRAEVLEFQGRLTPTR
jgi:hypothetical protein